LNALKLNALSFIHLFNYLY